MICRPKRRTRGTSRTTRSRHGHGPAAQRLRLPVGKPSVLHPQPPTHHASLHTMPHCSGVADSPTLRKLRYGAKQHAGDPRYLLPINCKLLKSSSTFLGAKALRYSNATGTLKWRSLWTHQLQVLHPMTSHCDGTLPPQWLQYPSALSTMFVR